jgi:hypothetical protein
MDTLGIPIELDDDLQEVIETILDAPYYGSICTAILLAQLIREVRGLRADLKEASC